MKSCIMHFSAASLLFLHYDCNWSLYSFRSFVTLVAETLYAVYVYFEAARIAMSVECVATGWVVRGSNTDGGENSLLVYIGAGAHPVSCTRDTGSFGE